MPNDSASPPSFEPITIVVERGQLSTEMGGLGGSGKIAYTTAKHPFWMTLVLFRFGQGAASISNNSAILL